MSIDHRRETELDAKNRYEIYRRLWLDIFKNLINESIYLVNLFCIFKDNKHSIYLLWWKSILNVLITRFFFCCLFEKFISHDLKVPMIILFCNSIVVKGSKPFVLPKSISSIYTRRTYLHTHQVELQIHSMIFWNLFN